MPSHLQGYALFVFSHPVVYLPFIKLAAHPSTSILGDKHMGSQELTPGKGSRLQGNGETQRCDSVPNVYRRADIVRRWRGLKRGCLSLHSWRNERQEIQVIATDALQSELQTNLAFSVMALQSCVTCHQRLIAIFCQELPRCDEQSRSRYGEQTRRTADSICQSLSLFVYEYSLPYVYKGITLLGLAL